MGTRERVKAILTVIVSGLVMVGCGATRETRLQAVSGTYRGTNGAGEPMVLTLTQEGQGFRGQGTVANRDVAISGIVTWTALSSLTHANGSSSLVEMSLSPDGEDLTIQPPGDPAFVLRRGGPPVTGPGGSFSGTYRPVGEDARLAQATIAQAGSLISGIAEVFDQTAAITGRVIAANKAEGLITFPDESQMRFDAELSSDGASLTLFGMGDPIVFERL